MITYRVEKTLDVYGHLQIEDLPFQPGDVVEVIVRQRSALIRDETSERELITDWLAASQSALRDVWDNDEDAVYDSF